MRHDQALALDVLGRHGEPAQGAAAAMTLAETEAELRRAGFEPRVRNESFHTGWDLGVLAEIPAAAMASAKSRPDSERQESDSLCHSTSVAPLAMSGIFFVEGTSGSTR
jgi:hypothetical protein